MVFCEALGFLLMFVIIIICFEVPWGGSRGAIIGGAVTGSIVCSVFIICCLSVSFLPFLCSLISYLLSLSLSVVYIV